MAQLVHHLRHPAGLFAQHHDALVVIGRNGAGHHHQVLLGQLTQADAGRPCQRVAGGQTRHQGLAGHQNLLETRRHPRRVHKTHIQALAQQVGQLLGRAQLAQHQAQTRVAALKAAEDLRQAAVQHGPGKTDVQLAGLALGHIAGLSCCRAGLRQQGPGSGHKGLARRRELHPPAVAGEQLRPHRGFELLNVQAERRLRNRQALGRTAKVQLFGQHEEIAQVTKFHELK